MRAVSKVLKAQPHKSVYVNGRCVRVAVLIADAWNVPVEPVVRLRHIEGPLRGKFAPRSCYDDGRIVPMAEYRRALTRHLCKDEVVIAAGIASIAGDCDNGGNH